MLQSHLIEKIPAIRRGEDKANLGIEKNEVADIIKWGQFWGMFQGGRGLHFLLESKAERWLHPNRALLDFIVGKSPDGYSVQISQLGADAGVTTQRSGFLLTLSRVDGGIGSSVGFIPEIIPAKYQSPRVDMENPYWQHQHEFVHGVNHAGKDFVAQLQQEPALNHLRLARSLIDHAMHPKNLYHCPFITSLDLVNLGLVAMSRLRNWESLVETKLHLYLDIDSGREFKMGQTVNSLIGMCVHLGGAIASSPLQVALNGLSY